MVLAVDEDDGSVPALIRFLPIVAIEQAAVNALVPCRIRDLDASFAPTSMARRGELSRLAFFPPAMYAGDEEHGDDERGHSDENAIGQVVDGIRDQMQRTQPFRRGLRLGQRNPLGSAARRAGPKCRPAQPGLSCWR